MTSPKLERPRNVTTAGVVIIAGSIMTVLFAFQSMSQLRSADTRASVEDYLSTPPGSGLGLSVETVLSGLHVANLVAGGCAAAAAVLGWFVLQQERSARLALTFLAPLLLVAGLVTGGLTSTLVAAFIAMLWFQPAKAWFNGERPPSPVPVAGPASAAPGVSTAGWPPAPSTGPPGASAAAQPSAAPAPRRPDSLVWAAIITWLGCGLTVVMTMTACFLIAADPDRLLSEVLRQNPELVQQGISESMLITSTYVLAGVAAVWAVLVGVLAVLALRRKSGPAMMWRILTIISAGFLVVGSLASIAMVVPFTMCMVTMMLLRRPEVVAWLRDASVSVP